MVSIKTPDNYLQEAGVISRVGEYVLRLANRVLIITGSNALRAAGDALQQSLAREGISFEVVFLQGKCTLPTLQTLAQLAKEMNAEGILGLGGGAVMDTAKGVGELAGQLPVIQVPTVAATCAAWSPFSVLYNAQGGHDGSLPLRRFPAWILVDTQVIAASPVRFLKAGIVDALAKWFEFNPYQQKNGNDLALTLQLNASLLAVNAFEQFGIQAVEDNFHQRVTQALTQTIDAVIALAGLANSVRDESHQVGVAHAIHNSMTHHEVFHRWLHGEKVGYGLAVQAILQHSNPADRDSLLGWLRKMDMPLTPAALGIGDNITLLEQIAAGVKIKPEARQNLPFAVDSASLATALKATHTGLPGELSIG
ncbi:iron-containing alcohol dehydrogenase family protein [Pantoea cypripedii]|uniref:Oxidoreductase n=1 Tax=Pantoea cypripedii TaxID=55209 RepID=A0A6B9G5Z5_PANCY|nr:iron-containing alcohol dehydrogenase family protein [Pantoea cypripedii]QGY33151.1 oxidoreductase [Pantoea cypripedii]